MTSDEKARPFLIAHLTDPHIGPLPRPSIRALLCQRILGYLSWRIRRWRVHRPEILAALVDDLRAHAPDHIAVTGDLVNISLPAEFPRTSAWSV